LYFRKALRINPGFLQARENLENLFGHLVERWHFRMLNDRNRNKQYERSITQAVKDGCKTVLDIGTGSGLLA
jgi:type II protein arginine methyltransferase